jgi:hypothetical protein
MPPTHATIIGLLATETPDPTAREEQDAEPRPDGPESHEKARGPAQDAPPASGARTRLRRFWSVWRAMVKGRRHGRR